MKTYKYPLYPNREQTCKLWLHANKLNWLYNHFLSLKIETYKKYSNKTKYLTKVIKKLYSDKNNKIKDFYHKVSKDLSSNYNTVVIENLKIVNMILRKESKDCKTKKTRVNKALLNAHMGLFVDMLKYKCKTVLEVNPMYTSQCCNNCGTLQKMPLSERTYRCGCGYIEDSDVNAAKNIKCLGQAMLFSTTCTVKNILDVFTENLVCSASR